MRKIVKKTVLYKCEKCGTKYPKAKDAKECETGTVEKRKFKRGDRVRAKEPRECSTGGRYTCRGIIKAIGGPAPFDCDTMKWIINLLPTPHPGHLWEYIVSHTCPFCKDEMEDLYFAAELVRIPRRKPR